jgi:hypothetical protein
VQFAVDQQQFIFALEQLNQLQQQMAQHQVSPALQHGLIKAIEQDKQNIQQYVLLQTQQRQQFDSFGNPVLDEAGEFVYSQQPFLGVLLAPERRPLPLTDSLEASGTIMLQIGNLILQLPQKVVEITAITFGGGERDNNGPISIVGIGQIAGEVASSDRAGFVDKFATGIQILGSLNFALFVFNMIPLLPLDGGHVAGGIYESIKRGLFRLAGKKDPGPADTALLMPMTYFVFIGLLVISALLITADLVNPVSIFG